MKLGCVPYINALPLTFGLDPQKVEIIARPPAQLFKLLDAGQVDAALLPVINYFDCPDLFLIPNIAIASRGSVESVKLFIRQSGCPLEEIKNIYLDSESETSQNLLRVLLHHRYRRPLSEINFISDPQDPKVEAKLLIGDKALQFDPQEGKALDLGKEWWDWLRQPFVFAAWMTRQPSSTPFIQTLQESREYGLRNLPTLMHKLTPYSSVFLKDYFTRAIHYYMGPEELAGVQAFYNFLKPIRGYTHELHFRFVSED